MLMKTVNNIKIISIQYAKTSCCFAILSYCLKSPLGILSNNHGRNPNLFFHLRMISCGSKEVRFYPL
jgi:hypothetical protein